MSYGGDLQDIRGLCPTLEYPTVGGDGGSSSTREESSELQHPGGAATVLHH